MANIEECQNHIKDIRKYINLLKKIRAASNTTKVTKSLKSNAIERDKLLNKLCNDSINLWQ